MQRSIKEQVRGFRTQDGAGVSLVRVLGKSTVEGYDPILMLDSFDSINPDEYTAGFPMHPHRGIETISYVYRGRMTHSDSLGNSDTIGDGEVQWMTAGSGILHEERLSASERLLRSSGSICRQGQDGALAYTVSSMTRLRNFKGRRTAVAGRGEDGAQRIRAAICRWITMISTSRRAARCALTPIPSGPSCCLR